MFDARSVRRVRRLFYGDGRFEQSLDVYAPASANTPLPLVILVVGSAWLGHLRLVYGPTSWWNSSGPRTVASAGAVCVCIRHRGAFPPPPPAAARAGALLGSTAARLSWLGLLALALALSRGVAATIGGGGLLLLLLRAWDAAAVNSATIEEMVDDVAAALALVLRERDALLPAAADLSTGFGLLSDSAPRLSGRTYFGGYSSGAHVASSLLLPRPPSVRARARHRLPSQLCDCVLHISGVFGGGESAGYPRALASVVFGASDGPVLPSPALSASQLPAIPQVHVRCTTEAFGAPVVEKAMQAVLAASPYEDAVRLARIPIRVHPVSSNHWSILSSAGLRDAIAWELEREVPSAPDSKAGHDTAAAALAVAPPTPRTRLELRRRR